MADDAADKLLIELHRIGMQHATSLGDMAATMRHFAQAVDRLAQLREADMQTAAALREARLEQDNAFRDEMRALVTQMQGNATWIADEGKPHKKEWDRVKAGIRWLCIGVIAGGAGNLASLGKITDAIAKVLKEFS